MILADRIRIIRETNRLSQSEVAHRCNISPSAYGQMERNPCKCSLDTLTKIASALNVPFNFYLILIIKVF